MISRNSVWRFFYRRTNQTFRSDADRLAFSHRVLMGFIERELYGFVDLFKELGTPQLRKKKRSLQPMGFLFEDYGGGEHRKRRRPSQILSLPQHQSAPFAVRLFCFH